ncbi:MAG: serine O-acetyltransferase [Catonella sp.]|uniref:serine O-acetyltransferase n=1 Tax=Catonella sp. TaxID=2382125 RepID=UPI003F9F3841
MGFIKFFKEESAAIIQRDPAIKSKLEVLLYPGFRIMLRYRIAHKLYLKGHYLLARKIMQKGADKVGIDIHPGATIGNNFFIDHGIGVIIGETAIIGDNCTIYQGVTLGGTGKQTGKRHPTIGNNVMISAGAKVLGNITIGDNTKIGAGSVVLKDIPPNSTVVGVPGRIVKRNNIKCEQIDLDQVHFPDPVSGDINELREENCKLRKKIEKLAQSFEEFKKGKNNENT